MLSHGKGKETKPLTNLCNQQKWIFQKYSAGTMPKPDFEN